MLMFHRGEVRIRPRHAFDDGEKFICSFYTSGIAHKRVITFSIHNNFYGHLLIDYSLNYYFSFMKNVLLKYFTTLYVV